MNDIQSYTPVGLPFSNYDSLASRLGSDSVSGIDYSGWLAFTSLTVAHHDPNSPIFNQPDTVSYSLGPAVQGSSVHSFNYTWAAWVATLGVRDGQFAAIVPPSDNLGFVSNLYPNTKPSKIAHAFNNAGLLAMAIPAPGQTEFIQLKRYTDNTGTTASMDFAGYSAILFNSCVWDSSIPSQSGLVCLYLRSELPNTIFGRFESDSPAFGIEHQLMPDIRATPERLIGVIREGQKQALNYIDNLGRDCSLVSPDYASIVNVDHSTINTAITGGRIINQTIYAPAITPDDKASFSVALIKGLIYDATIMPSATTGITDSATIAYALIGGSINTP